MPLPKQPDHVFQPAADWPTLQRRAALLVRLRSFFADRGFVEVETPLLSADTVVDVHLDPFRVVLFDDPRDPAVGPVYWLQTSPEFAMKRLLAHGATAIFQVTRAFRGGESGRWHNPEFTMVEWYRVGDDYRAGILLLDELTQHLLSCPAAERLTYAAAFQRFAGVDPHQATLDQLAAVAERHGLHAPQPVSDLDRDCWLNFLHASLIQPQLGRERPTILIDFPASQSALSAIRQGPPEVAERFELYVSGVELANGYHELQDAGELRTRALDANAQRQQDGKYGLPAASRLLDAMDHGLPACVGVALGFDRLVMIAAGASSIRDVIAFPFDLA